MLIVQSVIAQSAGQKKTSLAHRHFQRRCGISMDPISIREFHEVLQYYRMDRLLEKYLLS